MRHRSESIACVIVMVCLSFLILGQRPAQGSINIFEPEGGGPSIDNSAPRVQKAELIATLGRLPLHFIENRGQAGAQVKFYHQGPGHTIYLTTEGLCLIFPNAPSPVLLKPLGLQKGLQIKGDGLLEGKVNYFRGNNPGKWLSSIPMYREVLYQEAYPGIDLKFYGSGRQLEYDIIVRPGADPGQLRMRYEGVKSLEITPVGELAIKLPNDETLLQKQPLIYQEVAGRRIPREGKFKLLQTGSDHVYGFEVAAYDPKLPLVIDPVLTFSTYLGGSQVDIGRGIALDQAGNIYVTGETASSNFPKVGGIYDYKGGKDVFVTKINATGTAVVYSTFLGGSTYSMSLDPADDIGYGIAVDQEGNAYVTGSAGSDDFPTKNALPYFVSWWKPQPFVARINAAGTDLDYSTFLSGYDPGASYAIAVDGAGNAYITGRASGGPMEFPQVNPLYPSGSGLWGGGFVAKIGYDEAKNATSLIYSSYLGGINVIGYGIAVDTANNAYVTGVTGDSFMVPAGTPSPIYGFSGGQDAFVTKVVFNEALSQLSLAYFTYLGGSATDIGHAIAVDQKGHAYATGETSSSNFPRIGGLHDYKGGKDAFVTKINASGTAVRYSTFLGGGINNYGGTVDDIGYGIAVDRQGQAYVTGTVCSDDFPTKNALPYFVSWWRPQVFVTKLNAAGSALVYSTYLSAYDPSYGYGIALGKNGAYVTGGASWMFPMVRPIYGTWNGYTDAFVAKLMEPHIAPLLPLLLSD